MGVCQEYGSCVSDCIRRPAVAAHCLCRRPPDNRTACQRQGCRYIRRYMAGDSIAPRGMIVTADTAVQKYGHSGRARVLRHPLTQPVPCGAQQLSERRRVPIQYGACDRIAFPCRRKYRGGQRGDQRFSLGIQARQGILHRRAQCIGKFRRESRRATAPILCAERRLQCLSADIVAAPGAVQQVAPAALQLFAAGVGDGQSVPPAG